ncbi:MAG: DNA translocase FtsK 4TM domain-containing protein [Chloroflexi bacterium]|nr:DNA translocase FtsK 4TM domain-containing protein [Chloroflexota bacterium]
MPKPKRSAGRIAGYSRRLLPLALIAVGGGLLAYKLAPALGEALLRTLGLSSVFWPVVLGVSAWTAWRRPHLLRRHWRRWLGVVLLGLALTVTLSFFAPRTGILAEATLGGHLGRALGQNLPLVGAALGKAIFGIQVELPGWRLALSIMALGLAGFLLIAPRATVAFLDRLAWGAGRAGYKLGRGLLRWLASLIAQGIRRLRARRRSQSTEAAGEMLPSPAAASPPAPAERLAPLSAAHSRGSPASTPSAVEAAVKTIPLGSTWKLPPLSLLEGGVEPAPNGAETQRRAHIVEEALASYGIEARVVEVSVGPTVTRFGVEPGWVRRHKDVPERDAMGRIRRDEQGHPLLRSREVSRTRVKVEAIANLHKDLALALASPSVRIEAPVPGKGYVGLEVPNSTFTPVTMRNVLESPAFSKLQARSKLALALGKGVGGEPVVFDLATLPHLLLAGATGSGKSVCLKSILTCVAMNATPDEVRLILVDPKRVELSAFGKLPHLLSPPVIEVEKASEVLKELIAEMESRYRKFAALKVNNLLNYNKVAPERHLPYVALVVDELADLMMVAPVDIEQGLCRLAQLGRAAGIHLVVATQRPSVDVVTGLIKANFPARVGFAVASQVDSRVILDSIGAEKLLGRGDMLFQPTDSPQPKRVQGVYVSDGEIERVVEHWARQAPVVSRRIDPWPAPPPSPTPTAPRAGEDDPLLNSARELVGQFGRASPSLLQRRLHIGLSKAKEILEALEAQGVVGPADAGESRQVRTGGSPQGPPQEGVGGPHQSPSP